ncbi:L-aminoadipate-semialdehyde dehydrogenase-phosphopantetheinyl transferase-like [Lineus longissimus]|uniref:L-aminoadipate-semialdehyde dehydrogenase-phosphopantetheinyl transferase-like n=1 Tax=Lineus longissimus TaxID=88925 RepID=UPI002B4D2B1B
MSVSDSKMSASNVARTALRWAFNFGSWRPTKAEWMLAAQCVQMEEKNRIGKFVFKRDAKSAMAGRLLLRKAISDTLQIPYGDVRLDRTEKGKPFLVNTVATHFSFNVSHQGKLAVLATEFDKDVGIDVMEITQPRGSKSVADFFHTMRRQFTDDEWEAIKEPMTDSGRLARFYRFWCLKESYVKAVGIGIGYSLQRLSFKISTPQLRQGNLTKDTVLFIDGIKEVMWEFHETMVDEHHCTAVAVRKTTHQGQNEECDCDGMMTSGLFEILSFSQLVVSAQPCLETDLDYWEAFDQKDESPGGS